MVSWYFDIFSFIEFLFLERSSLFGHDVLKGGESLLSLLVGLHFEFPDLLGYSDDFLLYFAVLVVGLLQLIH